MEKQLENDLIKSLCLIKKQYSFNSFFSSLTLSDDERELLLNDDFSLLLGVIADQSVNSNIAWRLPFRLTQRANVNKITPEWILNNQEHLVNLIREKPALHRFPAKMADYFISLSKMISLPYSRMHGVLFKNLMNFDDLIQNLVQIKGVSRKKAGLLCLILEEDRNLIINHTSNSYALMDSHVKRFISTKLKLNHQVTEVEATDIFRHIIPQNPALVSTVIWDQDRKR